MSEKNEPVAYVDNKEFLVLMKQRREAVLKAQEDNKPIPRIPENIGKIILDISTNLAYKGNFANYTFRDEMISDGIENCIKYLDNFDSVKYSNPFAYFTQICWWAFVRRINKEGSQTELKQKYVHKFGQDLEAYDTQPHDMDEVYHNTSIEFEQDKQ